LRRRLGKTIETQLQIVLCVPSNNDDGYFYGLR
jgi:hypothetical protein